MKTRTTTVDPAKIGSFNVKAGDLLDEFEIVLNQSPDAQSLDEAAKRLQTSDIPVAFPTETVYGLGADATRSSAVKGIYTAKQRPSDNPLIVHFASLCQIKQILDDQIPIIYEPLIKQFWPGPLTILLPNAQPSKLAPEVTAGQTTFGARIPRHPTALALIQAAGVPVAAPSANASTKPSPTAAEHVAYDLDGRIELIVDSGPCEVGVESTVVDGLTHPPVILRPGGISLEQIRSCPGWEHVTIGYKDTSEQKPRAPGMKYRHYSPKAPVMLVEGEPPALAELGKRIGMIRTRTWVLEDSLHKIAGKRRTKAVTMSPGFAGMLQDLKIERAKLELQRHVIDGVEILDVDLGGDAGDIARGIFSALRLLDRENVDLIVVEGIADDDDLAAAVMNRLRKAAEIVV